MRLTREEFVDLVREAYEGLPAGVKGSMDNLEVTVQYWPSRQELRRLGLRNRHSLFGLYSGVPLTERGGWLPSLPDIITIYQRPVEMRCTSRDDLVKQVRITLLHEVGHYLGMDEDELARRGYG